MSDTTSTSIPAFTPPSDAQGQASALQSLWDRGAFDAPSAAPEADAAPSAPVQEDKKAAPEAPAATPPAVEGADADAPAEPQPWEDFDEYLKAQAIDAAKAKVKVKVDGEERQVTFQEALKAYELSQAGHARMAEAAKAREALASQRAEALQMLQQRAAVVETVNKEVAQYFLNPYQQAVDDAARSGDRGAYAAACYDRDQAQAWFNTRMQAVAQEQQQRSLIAQQAMQQELPKQRELMLARHPEWQDAARFDADRKAIHQYGTSNGFTEAEISSIADHRHISVLHSAAQMAAAQQAASVALGKPVTMADIVKMAGEMAKLQASAPEVSKRVSVAPTMQSKPGTRAAPKDAATVAHQAAMAQVKKSGYADSDVAAVLDRMFR